MGTKRPAIEGFRGGQVIFCNKGVKFAILPVAALLMLLLTDFQCGCVRQECYEGSYFRVLDARTGENLFFGNKAIAHPDSVYVTDKETWKRGYQGMPAWGGTNDSLLHLHSWQVSDTFYLSFTGDVDTIVCRYRYEKTDCCDPYYHVRQLEYNGEAGVKSGQVWELRKRR